MRERPPDRRNNATDNIRWPLDGGKRIHVTAGFARDGRIVETFLRGGGQVGSERDHLLDDVAVLVSRCLQHGDSLADIAAGVGREPSGAPASVIGAAVDCLRRVETEIP
jgi:hypothetical protein